MLACTKREAKREVFWASGTKGEPLPTITGDHSESDLILFVNVAKYIGFCVYRGSYLIWSPVINTASEADLHMHDSFSSS